MLGVFFCTVSFPSDGRTNNIKAVLLLLLLLGTVYVDNSVYIYTLYNIHYNILVSSVKHVCTRITRRTIDLLL